MRLVVLAVTLVLLAPGRGLATDASSTGEASPSEDRVVLESWKRPLFEALSRDRAGWRAAWVSWGVTSGAVLVAAPIVDIPAWNPRPNTPPGGTPGLWIMAPTGGMALAFSSLSAGSALHAVNHGVELVEHAGSPTELNAELRRLGREVATPGYILAGITLTTGIVGVFTFGHPLWVSSGITALVATPFLHAGGAYQIQARRARGVMDRRAAAQLSVSPFGLVLRW